MKIMHENHDVPIVGLHGGTTMKVVVGKKMY
jgi:hypothetical protein